LKRLAWLIFCGLAGISLILLSCSSSSSTTTAAIPVQQPVQVAIDPHYPPFESQNEKSLQLEGFDVDLMNAIAAKEDFEVEYVEVAFDPLLAGMAQGKYALAISSIIINSERQKDMLFSDPYFSAGQIIVVQQENTDITDKDHLSGVVGALKGAAGSAEAEKMKGITLQNYDKIEMAFEDLMDGRINAVICENPIALLFVGKYPDKLKTVGSVFTPESYGIAIAKSKPELQTTVNNGLKAVKSEGLLEQLSQKWFK